MIDSAKSPKALNCEGFLFSKEEELSLAWFCYQSDCKLEALLLLDTLLSRHPCCAQAYYISSLCYQSLGDFNKAEEHCLLALECEPLFPEALNALGEIQYAQNAHPDIFLESFRKASELSPGLVNPIVNIGNYYWRQGDVGGAIVYYNKAIEASPSSYEGFYNYGRALQQQGRLDEAINLYSQALSLKEGHVDSLWNTSICYLLKGDYSRGWNLYDYRLRLASGSALHAEPALPLWRGERESIQVEQGILLVSEQGLGDTIQFCRYAKLLEDQGLNVRLCVQPQLHSLIVASGLNSSPILPKDCSIYRDGLWLPLLSLPGILGVSPDNVISSAPYVKPLKSHVFKWKKLLDVEVKPVVGIHWQGNHVLEATNESFQGRSIPLESFRPLLKYNDIKLLSLQKGYGSEQRLSCSFAGQFVGCQELIDQTWDFLETAAIIENCDLVITSDSAVAHLSGALGKTTWLLLKHIPEWRWGLHSDHTFWYPSVRIFRQHHAGDWGGLLEYVADELKKYLAVSRQMSRILTCKTPSTYGNSLLHYKRKIEDRVRRLGESFWSWVEAEGDASQVGQAPNHSLPSMQRFKPGHLEVRSLAPSCQRRLESLQSLLASAGTSSANDGSSHDLSGYRYDFLSLGLGRAFLRRECVDDALGYFRLALKLGAKKSVALSYLALCWQLKGSLSRAQGMYKAATRHGRLSPDMLCNYGCLLQEVGDFSAAIEAYQQSIRGNPSLADAHFNLSTALLTIGDYGRGWPEYEWRLSRASNKLLLADPQIPRWDPNDDLVGKTLLVMGEQGYGDIFNFWRYIELLGRSVADLVVCLPKNLHDLIRSSGFEGGLCSPDEVDSVACDAWVPLGSLPALFSVSPRDSKYDCHYIKPAAEKLRFWRDLRSQQDAPLVAICWQGRPEAERFVLRGRSMELELFSPLTRVEAISLLSLQKFSGADQLERCSFRSRFVDWQGQFDRVSAFSDVAAAMAACDLIITVDTYVAHLAGAMGLPVWLLLHKVPDWRWGLDGESSFWYPSVRLFRQRERGNWAELMERVASCLQAFVASLRGDDV